MTLKKLIENSKKKNKKGKKWPICGNLRIWENVIIRNLMVFENKTLYKLKF